MTAQLFRQLSSSSSESSTISAFSDGSESESGSEVTRDIVGELRAQLNKKSKDFDELEELFMKYRDEVKEELDGDKPCNQCHSSSIKVKNQSEEIKKLEILVQTLQEIEVEENRE